MLRQTIQPNSKKRGPKPGQRTSSGRSSLDKASLRAAGFWLQNLRIARGLTQQDVAGRLPRRGSHFVSQVEIGWIRLPAELIRPWAAALDMPADTLARQLMSFYAPELYLVLFAEQPLSRSA